MRKLHWLAVVLVGSFLATALPAQETPTPPDAAELKRLIELLDSPKFSDRQAATNKLIEAREAAIPALEAAATGPNREASTRSIDILKKHAQSKDEAVQKPAREALSKLAELDQPRIAAAAKEALRPPGKEDPNQGAPGVPQIQLGGPIQLQIQAFGGAMNRRVGIQNINGVKTTTVEENGKKIVIVDDPQNGIKVEITEKVDGKDQTKKFEAKDADDLKKKHPDAHKIYEEHSKQQGIQIQIGGGAIQAFPGIPPGMPGGPQMAPFRLPIRPFPAAPLPNRAAIQESLERSQKDLKEAEERIRKSAENSPQAEQLNKALEQLEAARKRLEEAVEQLKG